MRAVLSLDLDLAARALAAVDPAARPAVMALALSRAHSADRWRRASGRAHPHWGSGTLSDAFHGARLAPPPRRWDAAAAAALAAALAGLDLWRADPARRNRRRAARAEKNLP